MCYIKNLYLTASGEGGILRYYYCSCSCSCFASVPAFATAVVIQITASRDGTGDAAGDDALMVIWQRS